MMHPINPVALKAMIRKHGITVRRGDTDHDAALRYFTSPPIHPKKPRPGAARRRNLQRLSPAPLCHAPVSVR